MQSKRACGIVMPVTALSSAYGIGSLGRAAYEFIDFLQAAGQTYWQVLPLGPTGYADSPYQCLSAFAGNPYLIDLEKLREQDLLTDEELASLPQTANPSKVDYGQVYASRLDCLYKAYRRASRDLLKEVELFDQDHDWLDNYCLFFALKEKFQMQAWMKWPDEGLRTRQPEALDRVKRELADRICFHKFLQYLFFSQWQEVKDYAKQKEIRIIGDVPVYVAMDSADTWSQPELFLLDPVSCKPSEVAGVPPDFFSADGQLWGNPLYDWPYMEETGYSWWLKRLDAALELYDLLRIDHFRGLESYWAVPAEADTAKTGHWVKGPGKDFIKVLLDAYPESPFIAEDLGFLTPEVHDLLAYSGFPGMKVLEFAFDAREPSNYLPHTYPRQCVCFTGTHDNAPLAAWCDEVAPENLELAVEYLGLNQEEGYTWGLLRGGLASVADLFIAQMQDYLALGPESRTNTPGTVGGNWSWRVSSDQLSVELAKKMHRLSQLYGRC